MGSKTPQGHSDANSAIPAIPYVVGSGKPRGAQHDQDGDGEFGAGGDDDDDDDEAPESKDMNPAAATSGEKKKRKKRSKKKAPAYDNGASSPFPGTLKQSSPPRVFLSSLFPSGIYPVGAIDDNLSRTTGEESRYESRLSKGNMGESFLNSYRQAAEVHRQVRAHTRVLAQPGVALSTIADDIDDGVRALLGHDGLTPGDGLVAGLGFPTGVSVNNCAAHYTPNPGARDIVLSATDTLKVDFGVHVNGWIVDSAFTLSWDPAHDPLLDAVRATTNTGIREAGIDARMSELGAAMQEVMESYEIDGRRVRAIRSLRGHNIGQYRIHGGKSVPFVRNNSTERMEEGEVFAIETFGSTGRGYVRDDVGVFGYGLNPDAPQNPHLTLESARRVLKEVKRNFSTLVFCKRYIERLGVERYLLGLNALVQNGVIEQYAPLSDVKGCQTAQFEHTILLRHDGIKEVVSRGEDY